MRTLLTASAILIAILVPAAARADTATCDPVFSHEELATNLSWDTDWVPAGEKVQVRFTMSAKAGVSVAMPTVASLERGGSLTFKGKAGQGELKMGMWSGMTAKFRFTDLDFYGIKLSHEGDLPIPSSWLNKVNNIIEDKAAFTPLVLAGASPRPVKVDLHSPKLTIFTLSYPVFTIGIASITVKVPVALEAILKCDFQGTKVKTTPTGASQVLEHTGEGQAVPWPGSSSLTQSGSSVYLGDRTLSVVLKLYPSIEVKAEGKILGLSKSQTWKVAEFELSWTALTSTDTWTFKPQPLAFSFSAPPLSDAGTPLPLGDAGGWPPASDAGTPPPASDGGARPGSGDARPVSPGGEISSGCCSVALGPPPALAIVGVIFLGLLLRSRRRR
jgi:hypothetical protein